MDKLLTNLERKKIRELLNKSVDQNDDIIELLEKRLEILLQDKLKQTNQKYQVLMNNANDFIAFINNKFEFERINERIHYKKLGYKPDELLGHSVLNFIHQDDIDKILKILKLGFENGEATAEFRFKTGNNNYLWIEAKGKVFRDEQNRKKGIIISRDVSEQKVMEGKLRKSENKYRVLIQNLFDVVMKVDFKGTIQYVSPQIKSDYGYAEQEVIGKKIFDFIHQEDLSRVFKTFKKLREEKETISLKYRVRKKEGTYLWVLSKGRVVIEDDQKYIIGSMRNVDKNEKIYERLKESESKYRELFEGARDGFVMVDTDAHIKDANQAYCKMAGYSLEELRNLKSFYQITPEKWHDWEKQEIWEKKLLKQGHSGIYEKEYIRKDGTVFPIEVQAYTVFDQNKNVKYLWGVIRDITERKAAEQRIIKSEKKYRLLAENARDIIWVMDLSFNFTYMSPSVEEVRGYTVEEVMNQSLEELFTPESLRIAQQTIKKKLNPKKLKDPHYDAKTTLELEHTCKDGSTVWVEVKMSLLRDENGNLTGIIGVSRDITKRREMEKRLVESEENLRQKTEEQEILLDNINTQVWYLKDPETYGAVNKAHAEFYGVKKKDLEFKNLDDIYPNDVATTCQMGNIEVFDTKKQIHTEEWVPHKSGERRLISIIKTPKLDEKGDVEYVVCAAEDITKKREYQRKLEESRKRLRLFIDTSPDMFFLKDRNFRYILVNKANAEFFGKDEENIIGKTDFELMTQEAAEQCRKTDKKAMEQKKIVKNIETINGRIYETRKMPTLIDDKVEGVAGIIRDITEQNRIERKLKDSQQKYHDIAELLPDIIYETNKKGYLTYLNSLGFEKFGLSYEDLREGINLLDLVLDADKQKVQSRMKRILSGASLEPLECSIYKKDQNDEFYARIHSVAIYKNGIVTGIRGTISDISKIKESEKELIRLNNLKSELLRRTSHELKTPLVSIKGFSSLLLDQYNEELEENAITMIKEIKNGCNRLEKLIKDILDSARLDSGKPKINKKKYKLTDLIEETVRSLKGIISSRKQSVKLDLDDKLNVNIEKERFTEVLENIVSNALKYTPPGGKISIKTVDEKDNIIISVKDNGIGFTSEEKEQLFTKFGKIERYGEGYDLSIDGSGLGLYIAKKTAELHGGDIWMESAGRNKGSIFYISLPKS